MNLKLKKKERLLKKRNFQMVLASNNKKTGSYLKIYYSDSINFSKLGITASSHFGNAIERNFFKRRIREIFRSHKNLFEKPINIVVYPQKTAKNVSFEYLKKDFIDLIKDI